MGQIYHFNMNVDRLSACNSCAMLHIIIFSIDLRIENADTYYLVTFITLISPIVSMRPTHTGSRLPLIAAANAKRMSDRRPHGRLLTK